VKENLQSCEVADIARQRQSTHDRRRATKTLRKSASQELVNAI
jgi:hypothetical protein